jgi:hypothetical protein
MRGKIVKINDPSMMPLVDHLTDADRQAKYYTFWLCGYHHGFAGI